MIPRYKHFLRSVLDLSPRFSFVLFKCSAFKWSWSGDPKTHDLSVDANGMCVGTYDDVDELPELLVHEAAFVFGTLGHFYLINYSDCTRLFNK